MKNSFKTLIAAAVLAGIVPTVQAIPVSGSIFVSAFGSHLNIDKGLNTITIVDDTLFNFGNAQATGGDGDFFTGYTGILAAYKDGTYSPLGVANPLWNLQGGVASFTLSSIYSVDESGSGLLLAGIGTIHVSGFDDTTAYWSFSADKSGEIYNFSSTTTTFLPPGVPDGGTTVMLLGGALAGLGLLRKKLFVA